jgi:hypothetical protein
MVLVGDVSDLGRSQPAWLVNAGEASVAWAGKYPGDRVRIQGRLYEERHSDISAEVAGWITGMRWHKAVSQNEVQGARRISYVEPTVIYNTDKFPGHPLPIPPGILRMRELAERSGLKGPMIIKSSKTDRQPPAWAFEFILEV